MATVLITGVGGTGGTATVKTLLKHTTHKIVGVDMDPLAEGLYLAHDNYVVPPASSEKWVRKMVQLVECENVDVIIPLVDEELSRLTELNDQLPNVAFVAPRAEVIDMALDKYRTARELSKHGLGTPKTWLASNIEPSTSEFPLLVKPRAGRGSRGVEVVGSWQELTAYLDASLRPADEIVVQQYIRGVEYTTSVVATQENHLLEIVPKEVIEKRGNTVHGVTRHDRKIIDSCRNVFKAFKPSGPLNIQQLIDEETDEAYTIEINPRFSSTACLTVEAGVNELDLLIRDALGETVGPPDEFVDNLHMLRYTDGLFVKEDEILSDDTR